jgi:two-component system phosphate regulon sensor histidine kinase PhoR
VQIVTTIALGLFYVQQIKQVHTTKTIKTLTNMIPVIREDVLEFGLSQKLNQSIQKKFASTEFRVTVIDAVGSVVADSETSPEAMENHLMRQEVQRALRSGVSGTTQRFSHTLEKEMTYYAEPLMSGSDVQAVLRVAMPTSIIAGDTKPTIERLVIIGFVLLLCTVFGTLCLSKTIATSVQHLVLGAKKFSSGDLAHRIERTPSGELQELETELNSMAEQLNASLSTVEKTKEEQAAILRSMPTGVVALDSDKTILSMNRAAEKILEIPKTIEVEGVQLEAFLRDVDLSAYIEQTTQAKPQKFELVVPLDNGSGKEIIANVQPLCDDRGGVSGHLVLLDDVTTLRKLEGIRSDFSANVSHELRTPITSIKGYVETLLESNQNDGETKLFLETIAKSANRLEQIIEDLLALASIEQGEGISQQSAKNIPLHSVVERVVRSCLPETKITGSIITQVCDENVVVLGTEQLLDQACLNLVQNAVRYGGKNITIRVGKEGDEAILSVFDDGVGIPKNLHPRIFERFFRVDKGRSRETGGTGLGLAIVKHVAMAHGGSVSVHSLEVGIQFEVRIPAID